MKILILLPTFGYSSAARQVRLLAPELRQFGIDLHLATLGPAGPLAEGLNCQSLGRQSERSTASVWRLRSLIRDLRPDVIHAWRMPAIRAAALALLSMRCRTKFVVSEHDQRGTPGRLDGLLMKRATIVNLPLAVDLSLSAAPFDRPPNAHLIMCAGNLTADHGFRDAIWAFDMLKYVEPDLHLAVIGDGPERKRLCEFAGQVGREDVRVWFVSARPDVPALLPNADIVWIPSRANCGRQVLREAQAAGRPVIATRIPRLAQLIEDGSTGSLVPPRDPMSLASATRGVLRDPDRGARIGSAARKAVAGASPQAVVDAWITAYSTATP